MLDVNKREGPQTRPESLQTFTDSGYITLAEIGVSLRQKIAVALITVSSISWIVTLYLGGFAQLSLPWFITLSTMAAAPVVWLARRTTKPLIVLSKGYDRGSFSLVESYAITYVVMSVLLTGIAMLSIVYKSMPSPEKQQIVDIEFTSFADAVDNKQLLPGTKEHELLRERSSAALKTSQGALAPPPAPAANKQGSSSGAAVSGKAPPETSQEKAKKSEQARPEKNPAKKAGTRARNKTAPDGRSEARKALVAKQLVPPGKTTASRLVPWPPPMVPANELSRPPGPAAAAFNQPFLEEVQPPELVELMDNEGTGGLHVWQKGGSSTGGSGARSELMDYLKALNKRIKRAWMPPKGDSRQVILAFRIDRTGKLISIAIIESSGNSESDQAAIKALKQSAPFGKLPDDYEYPFLNLEYSFNYNIDKLTEVKTAGHSELQ